jgi:hypothetical protein
MYMLCTVRTLIVVKGNVERILGRRHLALVEWLLDESVGGLNMKRTGQYSGGWNFTCMESRDYLTLLSYSIWRLRRLVTLPFGPGSVFLSSVETSGHSIPRDEHIGR